MKSQFTLWCLMLFCASNAVAAVFTVSADENHPAQFTTLQAAHDAATAGDTIQWYGNSSLGSSSQFSKPLVITGVNSLTNRPSITFSLSSSGTQILGDSYTTLNGGNGPSSFEIKNSWIEDVGYFGGDLSCVNSIIGGIFGTNNPENFYSFHNTPVQNVLK